MTHHTTIHIQDHSPESALQGEETALQQLEKTSKKLGNIKEHLNQLVDGMVLNPSFFSRASRFWGNMPLWQKIGLGILFIAPFFITGLLAQVAVLLTISVFSLIAYTVSSLLLDNHDQQTKQKVEQLKASLFSLAQILETLIHSLNLLCVQLASDIKNFQNENKKLSETIVALSEQIKVFAAQNQQLTEVQNKLDVTVLELEQTKNKLMMNIKAQSDFMQHAQEKLDQAIEDYKLTQTNLDKKTQELEEVKKSMGSEVEKINTQNDHLQALVRVLGNAVSADEKQRAAFQEKLVDNLCSKNNSLFEFAERMRGTEQDLTQLGEEHRLIMERHKKQLNEQGKIIERLRKIETHRLNPLQQGETSPTETLSKIGLYSNDRNISSVSIEEEMTQGTHVLHI